MYQNKTFVSVNEVRDSVSYCCKAEIHMETSSSYFMDRCVIACKECGRGLSGNGLIPKQEL